MQGYIHSSRKAESIGFITCCSGSCTAKFWKFSFNDCESSLETKLRQKDVTGVAKDECSDVPPGAIEVTFDSKISGNQNVADDVREL
jgi:copper chaperone CopZ